MTKDKARVRLLGLVHPPGELVTERSCETMEAADAYAQAHTKAALADTLGLLEEIAKLQDSVVIYLHDGQTALEVWQHKGPGMEFRYQKQGRITPCHEENISRAEAEALLKGDAE